MVRIVPFSPELAPELAQIWFDGWHASHPGLVPDALTKLRTRSSFTDRLQAYSDEGCVALLEDQPIGFCLWRNDELYQLFVSEAAQGKGVAQDLVKHCLSSIADSGATSAHLDCAVGNQRAMAFYEKFGFRNTGPFETEVDTSEGPFKLQCLLYEIQL